MISIIVATARNRAIGKDNDFPWHLPNDMKHFRTITKGHAVIMGRGNYDHLMQRIGKLLPHRTNIIVTRNADLKVPGATVVHTFEEALKVAHADTDEVFVIGGARMYNYALPYTDKIYLTEIDTDFKDADAYFPEIDMSQWHELSIEHHTADEKHPVAYSFVELERIRR